MCISFYFFVCEVFDYMHTICTAAVAIIKNALKKDEASRRKIDLGNLGTQKTVFKSLRRGDNIEVGNTSVARKSVSGFK